MGKYSGHGDKKRFGCFFGEMGRGTRFCGRQSVVSPPGSVVLNASDVLDLTGFAVYKLRVMIDAGQAKPPVNNCT